MKPAFECSVTASILESGRVMANAGHAGAIVAGVGSAFAHTAIVRMIFAASILCWLVECWLAGRVAIDASLFRTLATEPEDGGKMLDELLTGWGLGRNLKERSMADRSRAALGLWRRQAAVLAIQLTSLATGIVIQAVGF